MSLPGTSTEDIANDVIVIGGGAAGLSAALVLARARRQVTVIDAGRPRNAPAARMHGYLGSDGLSPADLVSAGRAEVAGYGAELIAGTAVRIRAAGASKPGSRTRFEVTLEDGRTISGRRILVTTGLVDELPDVAGLRERWGRDVLHCPYCHGHEVRDQALGVIGGTPEAVTHALLIRQWSADLTYFANGEQPSPEHREQLAARAIRVVDGALRRVVIESDRLRGLELADGTIIARTAVFVRPRFVANDRLLTELGCTTHPSGWVAVDASGATSVPGVWAAGNAVNPRAQVITAAGEGSAAAIAINNDLVASDTAFAVANHRLTRKDKP